MTDIEDLIAEARKPRAIHKADWNSIMQRMADALEAQQAKLARITDSTFTDEEVESTAIMIVEAEFPGIVWSALAEVSRNKRRIQARAALAAITRMRGETND